MALGTFAAGCGTDGSGTPGDAAEEWVPLAEFGELCAYDIECVTGACFEGTCTRPCNWLADCPEPGYTCALADAGRLLCVTTRFATGPGTAGESCVIEACDEGRGFTCMREGGSDPNAYCTGPCTDDRDCPADMVCRDSADGRLCRPRGYCEPCVVDDQCGWANDDCLEDDAGGRFCSIACDPERPTTCPQDSICVEARPGRFGCKPAFGRCVGDGGYCHPCRDTADCAADATCLTDRYTKFSFCTRPCTVQADCPEQHYCSTDIGQCRPRKGSCQKPSGGKHTCQACSDFTDCFNGWCVDFAQPPDGRPDTCGDLCDPGDANACGPWGDCYRITDETGATIGHACFPHEGLVCWRYLRCVEECPGGPAGCSLRYCT